MPNRQKAIKVAKNIHTVTFACMFAFVLISTSAFAYPLSAGNLIPNPDFLTPEGQELSPYFWYHGSADIEAVKKSEFSVGPAGRPSLRALGIKGGEDREGQWRCGIDGLEKGRTYRLSFGVYREELEDGVFPEVEIFGMRVRMSNLFSFGVWQEFSMIFVAQDVSTTLRFINDHPTIAYFASPVIVKMPDEQIAQGEGVVPGARSGPVMPDFFPLVAYGARVEEFPFLRDAGFNGVVMGMNEKNAVELVGAAAKADLKTVASLLADRVAEGLAGSGSLLGWYVEDEPEGRSVPPEEIMNRVKRIRETGSKHPAFMAMVRPEFVKAYKDASDIILMDQYPIPRHPVIWLSKSMDEARHGGAENVWAVIQIFGGQGWKGKGWDRSPSYDEMKALSYLAIVHGARGLFFYTVKDGNYDIKLDTAHLEDVKRLLRELGSLSPYLLGEITGAPGFFSESLYVFAPDGSAPVHARTFSLGKRTIIIAVNVLDKEVKGRLTGIGKNIRWLDEYFSGRRCVVKDDNIADTFGPYEVKLYIAGKDYRKVKILDSIAGGVKGIFFAEVADSSFERSLGLMFRDLPSEDRGLLLHGDEEIGIHALNMKIPFDLIFFAGDHKVSTVFRHVMPCAERRDCRHYTSSLPSRMALEIKAGVADKLHIEKGDILEFH
jgi:uncharacterized membrane protein (UPF0127 family)